MDSVEALGRAYEQLSRTAANVTVDQLAGKSSCAEWDLRTMANHMLGAGWMFTLVNQGQSLGEDGGELVGDDLGKACAELATANVASWEGPGGLEGERTYPFGSFPAAAAVVVNVGEIAVHGWDLAKSTGQESTIDPEVAGLLFDFYSSISLDGYREHGAFGAEIAVDASAPTADRLLGLLGFQP